MLSPFFYFCCFRCVIVDFCDNLRFLHLLLLLTTYNVVCVFQFGRKEVAVGYGIIILILFAESQAAPCVNGDTSFLWEPRVTF